MLNLLSNAIKFTEQGKIKLVVTAALKIDNTYQLSFEITDNGIGISAEGQQKLFKPFSQVDNSISRIYGGTGLGLTICAQLVKQMGGEIGVKSTIGCGATFHFTIELLAISMDETQLAINSQNSDIDRAETAIRYPLTILIAEDNKINQVYCEKDFSSIGL